MYHNIVCVCVCVFPHVSTVLRKRLQRRKLACQLLSLIDQAIIPCHHHTGSQSSPPSHNCNHNIPRQHAGGDVVMCILSVNSVSFCGFLPSTFVSVFIPVHRHPNVNLHIPNSLQFTSSHLISLGGCCTCSLLGFVAVLQCQTKVLILIDLGW